VDITIGKIASWLFGVMLILAGFGSLTMSIPAALIYLLTGLFLIPNVRQEIDERYDIAFSRWVVVIIALIGMGLGGALTQGNSGSTSPTNANTGNQQPAQNTDNQDQTDSGEQDTQNTENQDQIQSGSTMPSGDPTEPVETYYNSILGILPNYERAARQAQQNVDTNSKEFNEFKTYLENQRNMNRRSGVTAELAYTELVDKNSTQATVTAAVNLESDGFNYETKELSVKLKPSQGEWLIKQAPNPYPTAAS